MNVLMLGDWTIDNNWICGIHRSTISSRTGQIHLRGLNENHGATEALCGAGATASIIHRAQHSENPVINKIVGVGVWHTTDTSYLTNMIHPPPPKMDSIRHLQPSGQYTRFLNGEIQKKEHENNSIELINISDIDALNTKEDLYTAPGTTRIIRVYHHAGVSSIRLLSRIDWESTLPAGRTCWINSQKIANQLIEKIKKK